MARDALKKEHLQRARRGREQVPEQILASLVSATRRPDASFEIAGDVRAFSMRPPEDLEPIRPS